MRTRSPQAARRGSACEAKLIAGLSLASLLLACKADSSAAGESAANESAMPAKVRPSASSAETPPSCAVQKPGAGTSCGPERSDDCCARARVPGGTVKRSYDGVNCKDPNYPATVGDFELDVYEVTVGRFRAFLDAGQGTREAPPRPGAGAHPKHADSGWSPQWNQALAASRAVLERELACAPGASWTPEPGDGETLPINCVTYYEALAFCAWDGGFLPTEAERNYVASGGDEQRVYPWSTPPDSMHIGPEHAVFGSPATAPVGTHRAGDGRWGHADLAGNVWEWTIDEVDGAKVLPTQGADFCDPAGMPVPCVDCAAKGAGSSRVLRGGGWGLPERGMAVAIRRGDDPSDRHHVFGIRCARPLGTAKVSERDCEPSCAERGCGDDGCGGSCGTCEGSSTCVDGRCAVVEYPRGRFGVAPGEVFPNVRLSVVADAVEHPEDMRSLALDEYWAPSNADARLAIYLTTGWAKVDRSRELSEWAAADPRVELMIVLLEGKRRGQSADAGNVRDFAVRRSLAVPVAMDTLAELPESLRTEPEPRLLIIDRSTMKIVASVDPTNDDAWSAALGSP